MASHHASLGRRTLEEIRQKRAAERLSKTASGADLSKQPPPSIPPPTDTVGIRRTTSGNVIETDISGLVSQLQDLQKRNLELDQENRNLSSKLHDKEVENDTLQKRLNDLEQNTVPSLRKALKDVAMEKDAAVVAREDFSAQLRALKKRLKEAEEEQYRAEEDAAALRAEINSLQQQAMGDTFGVINSVGNSLDQMQAMEKDLANLKSKLEEETLLRQQERQLLAEEQVHSSTLRAEKEELQEKLEAMSKMAEEISGGAACKEFTVEDKQRLEQQLHDMAVAVERLENSRQKLLLEIDSQSSEIERLFEENSNLSSAYQEAMNGVARWENQVKDCLKQNEELRGLLSKLRAEQASLPDLKDHEILGVLSESNKDRVDAMPPQLYTSDFASLKGELAKEQNRADALAAEVLQLSAQLHQATQAYNGLARLYKPVLRNIESNLLKLKQDGSVKVQ